MLLGVGTGHVIVVFALEGSQDASAELDEGSGDDAVQSDPDAELREIALFIWGKEVWAQAAFVLEAVIAVGVLKSLQAPAYGGEASPGCRG